MTGSFDTAGAEWFNEPRWQVADDVLEMHAVEGSDLWQRTSYGFVRDTAHALLHPLTSYGLHLYQDGALEGWRQVIDGARQLGPNLYHVRVGADGRTVINNRSQAVAKGEKPVEPDPQWKPEWIPLGEGDDLGGCEDSAATGKAGLLGMLALWMVTAAGLRRVSRRRPPSP